MITAISSGWVRRDAPSPLSLTIIPVFSKEVVQYLRSLQYPSGCMNMDSRHVHFYGKCILWVSWMRTETRAAHGVADMEGHPKQAMDVSGSHRKCIGASRLFHLSSISILG
jgi:hypothetical protein